MTNKEFAEKDESFKVACNVAGLPDHKTVIKKKGAKPLIRTGSTSLVRQASKWRLGKGKAWKRR